MLERFRSVADGLFRRGRFEDTMADELRFHIDAYAEDLVRAGVPADEAARRARVEFGGVERVKEDCRQARGLRLFDELRQDLRYASRMMAKTPGVTAAAIVSLALGIGANTAIFSLIDAVLLKTLPVKDPHQLYFLAHGRGDKVSSSSNYPLFERYRGLDEVFSGVTAYDRRGLKVSSDEGIELVSGQFVSGNYHAVLGVPFVLGRGFMSEPDRSTVDSLIAVISDSYWTRRFGRDPGVLGKTLAVNGRVVSIVGVTAPAFLGLVPGARFDVTLPMSVKALDEPEFLSMRDGWISLAIVGRLRSGVSEPRARAAIDAVFQPFWLEPENEWARKDSPDEHRSAALVPAGKGSEELRRRYSTALGVLMGMVCLVLLISCANVANLLLARAAARAKEVAVRMSVGAGRPRLVRQFLTESLLLAGFGGACGLLFAVWGTDAIVSLFRAGQYPVLLDVSLNARVLVFTTVISMLTGILFGLVPAIRATRIDLTPALKENGSVLRRPRRYWAPGKALVVCQVALSVVLLAGAGLLVRSLRNLKDVDAGFEKHNVLLFSLDATGTAFPPDRLTSLCTNLAERFRALPGVLAASCSTLSPTGGSESVRLIHMPGTAARAPEARAVWANDVTPGYFQALGIGLLRGRGFSPHDSPSARKVAIVNETMARFYFGESDPLGRTFGFGSLPPDTIEIVGVVEDARQRLRETPPRMVYTPLAQAEEPPAHLTAEIRTTHDASSLAASVRGEVRALSRDVVVDYIRTMEQQIDASLVRERVLATLSTWFGVLAVLLACVGLYGVMSYDVTRRAREIGIRIALGADRVKVLWQVVRDTQILSAAGIAIGLGIAFATTPVVASFLYGLSARDPITLAAATAILLTTTLAAGYLPARRAAGVDPVQALRSE